jgi:hypothetical protein
MAKLMLIGEVAEVELTSDPEDGQIVATCSVHDASPACTWTERYDDMDDAVQYAGRHADRG